MQGRYRRPPSLHPTYSFSCVLRVFATSWLHFARQVVAGRLLRALAPVSLSLACVRQRRPPDARSHASPRRSTARVAGGAVARKWLSAALMARTKPGGTTARLANGELRNRTRLRRLAVRTRQGCANQGPMDLAFVGNARTRLVPVHRRLGRSFNGVLDVQRWFVVS